MRDAFGAEIDRHHAGTRDVERYFGRLAGAATGNKNVKVLGAISVWPVPVKIMPGATVSIAAVIPEGIEIIAGCRIGETFVLITDFGADFVVVHETLSSGGENGSKLLWISEMSDSRKAPGSSARSLPPDSEGFVERIYLFIITIKYEDSDEAVNVNHACQINGSFNRAPLGASFSWDRALDTGKVSG